MREALIVAAKRTPIGKNEGVYAQTRADELGAAVVRALVDETRIPPRDIDDVAFGCVFQVREQNMNVARIIGLLAGLPIEVPGVTINRFCGSSLQAINQSAHAIKAGDADVIVAGGVEHMTHVPMGSGEPLPHPQMIEKYPYFMMGPLGEKVAEDYSFSREELDRFSWESHRKAVAATREGKFKSEIVPIEVSGPDGQKRRVEIDESPRPNASLEKMATLVSAFKQDGKLTAANSSPVTDGAAAVLVMSRERVQGYGLKPMVAVRSSTVVAVHPSSLLGPIPAIRKLLDRAELRVEDIDLFEINEAFSSVALACMKDLKISPERLNVNGGAVALGHPLGASGARITTTLAHEMARRGVRWGVAAMCIGYGQGIATLYERVV